MPFNLIKKLVALALLASSVTLLYFNWTFWHNPIVGAFGLVLYFGLGVISWGGVVRKFLPMNGNWCRIFGFLTAFYLSAFAIGMPIVLWKYHRPTIAIILFIVGLVGLILGKERQSVDALIASPERKEVSIVSFFGINLSRKILLGCFALLAALFVFLLFHGRAGVYILSPWDALSSFVLILFFGLCFVALVYLFWEKKTAFILGLIVALSFLTHLYLPLVYKTGFGGDKWRHLGAEKWLQEGKIYTPSVWGEEKRSMASLGPLSVPEALVAGNKTSYSAQWATTIFLSESLDVDLFWVDLLLVFILWSFFLPLILYQFGRVIPLPSRERHQLSLLLAILPTLFYTFQSEGAITIPVSFGHLFFFFVLLLWIYYLKSGRRPALGAAVLLTLFFYWGYVLNFLVLLAVGALAITYRRYFIVAQAGAYRILAFALLAAFFIFALPALEIIQGHSTLPDRPLAFSALLDKTSDAFGQMTGLVGVIVSADFVDQGNFLYNQSKETLSRLSLFDYRVVPMLVSVLVWFLIFWGIYRAVWRERDKILTFLAILLAITTLAYFISWSFTAGTHILARRLNETIVFLMLIFLAAGLLQFLTKSLPAIATRKKILLLAFVLSFAATSTYASGPKLQLVTADELAAAKAVWSEAGKSAPPYCVIANTWPLLALEAVSGRQITGGGFPLYNEYAQPERVKIFENLSKDPDPSWLAGAFRLTGAPVCYYLNEKRWINDLVARQTTAIFGEPMRLGEVYIWKVENKENKAL